MKKEFVIPVTVKAFSRQEGEAKINLLLQGGSFIQDFNVADLAGAVLNHFVWAKLGETANKMRLERVGNKEKQTVAPIIGRFQAVNPLR